MSLLVKAILCNSLTIGQNIEKENVTLSQAIFNNVTLVQLAILCDPATLAVFPERTETNLKRMGTGLKKHTHKRNTSKMKKKSGREIAKRQIGLSTFSKIMFSVVNSRQAVKMTIF